MKNDPYIRAIRDVAAGLHTTESEQDAMEYMISYCIGALAMRRGYSDVEKSVLGYLDTYKEMVAPDEYLRSGK